MTFNNLPANALAGGAGIRKYIQPAPKVIGYALDDYWAIVEPPTADVTNLITNPSIELNTTGYAAHGAGSIARVLTQQRFGAASLQVTPGAGTVDGVLYDNFPLVAGAWYRISFWFKAQVAGYKYQVAIFSTAAIGLGTRVAWTSTGNWQYVSLLYYETASSSRRFYLRKDSTGINPTNTSPFWIDGIIATNYYADPLVYFDGDSVGYVPGRNDFYWTSTPHGSTSIMLANTRAGGAIKSLASYGFTLLAMMGLGLATPDNIAIPLVLPGGEQYQDTLAVARSFDLVGILESASGRADLDRRHSALAAVLDARHRPYRQPLTLLHELVNECGDSMSEIVKVQASLAGGLEGIRDNNYREDLDLRFRIHVPYVAVNVGSGGGALNLDTTIANANFIIHRDALGNYSALGTGGNAKTQTLLYRRGVIYAGGVFTLMGGVANTVRIAKWDTATGVWTPLGTGASSNTVSALAMDALGILYAGGSFGAMGGVANTRGIAKWNGSVWSAMGTGADAAFTAIQAIVAGPDNRIYAAGLFNNMGGIANTANIAAWSGTAWVSITPAGAANGTIFAMAIGPDGNLYVAGSFTTINGVSANRIAKYNLATGVWTALGTGAPSNTIITIAFGPDGTLYAGGSITSIGGVAVDKIAYWNGYAWSELGTGVTATSVNHLLWNPVNNLLYVAATSLTAAGGITMPDSFTIWNGSQYLSPDVNLPAGPDTTSLAVDQLNGAMVVGFTVSGTATAASTATVLTNTGSADTFPIFKWIAASGGDDKLQIFQITNQTTGESIYYNNLTLISGETLIFDWTPGQKSITSDFRGDRSGHVAPGSNNATFHLAPGLNLITVFQQVFTGSNPSGLAYWYPAYAELEDAVR